MILGAHVRRGAEATRGVVDACRARGADCAQVFLSNPRGWAAPADGPVAALGEAVTAAGISPLAAHAPYLVNVASPNSETLARSRSLARATVRAAARAAAGIVVVHAGSAAGSAPDVAAERAADSLRKLGKAHRGVRVAVELTAGSRGAVASTIAEGARLLEHAGEARLGLCLDTAHLFAAGYPLDGPDGAARIVTELRDHGLLDRLLLIHANDAEFPRGSGRDRHANIGDGGIGDEGFRILASTPELARIPWVLETPGDAARQAADIAKIRAWGSPAA